MAQSFVIAVVALLAARAVVADYWITCESTSSTPFCLIELNYNQFLSSVDGANALTTATQSTVRRISYSGTPTAGGCLLYQVFESCDDAVDELMGGNFGSRRSTNSCFYPSSSFPGVCNSLTATGQASAQNTAAGITAVNPISTSSSAASAPSNSTSTPISSSTSTASPTPRATSSPSTPTPTTRSTPATVNTPSGQSTVSSTTGSVPGLVVPSWGRKLVEN